MHINRQGKNVAVVGLGIVGTPVARWFGKEAYKYSLHEGTIDEVRKREYVFCCLPTPYKMHEGYSLDALHDVLRQLRKGQVVILKSTVLPGTTRLLAEKYKHLEFFFNPEFLREKYAQRDFVHPAMQILGITRKGAKHFGKAKRILASLPDGYMGNTIVKADIAESVKLLVNNFLAMKVVFANQFADFCKDHNVSYNHVVSLAIDDARLGDTHWHIAPDGYRGYGGSCFPKDVGAVATTGKLPLLKSIQRVNEKYRKGYIWTNGVWRKKH